jgi:hypothetical protein
MNQKKQNHFILIKITIQQEITIINICALIIGKLNFIKQTLLVIKTQMDPNTIIVGVFNTLLSPINRSSRQKKINKEPTVIGSHT